MRTGLQEFGQTLNRAVIDYQSDRNVLAGVGGGFGHGGRRHPGLGCFLNFLFPVVICSLGRHLLSFVVALPLFLVFLA